MGEAFPQTDGGPGDLRVLRTDTGGEEGRRPHFKVQPRAQASSTARWAAGLSPAAARTRSVLQAAPLPSAASGFHLLPVSLRPRGP